MKSNELNKNSYYLTKDNSLLNSYSFYGDMEVKEITNLEFLGVLEILNTKRATSKATIVVKVFGHPEKDEFTAEIGLGAVKDMMMNCKIIKGKITGKFKFGKRGKNYFVISVKN